MGIMVERKDVLFNIKEVGEILGSRLEGDPGFHLTSIRGIKIDSREIEGDDLFIAAYHYFSSWCIGVGVSQAPIRS